MRKRVVLAGFSSLVLIAACGNEIGRIPFSQEGSGQASIAIEAGDVSFWTDIDIEYEGLALMEYRIELRQGGAAVGAVECNPLGSMNVKTMWVETNVGARHSRSGNGKMACSIRLAAGGPTVVAANLQLARKPSSLVLKKADLVLKQ